jgi:Fe-Mn family superoxide dismutase
MRISFFILAAVFTLWSVTVHAQPTGKKPKPAPTQAPLPAIETNDQQSPPGMAVRPPVSIVRYTLPALPYGYAALEPAIDSMTMLIHHSKHHQAYITNFNIALGEKQITEPLWLDTLLANISKYPPAMRNNGGGHYNHSLFWNIMSPAGGGAPKGLLAATIERTFGSFMNFKEAFAKAGTTRFGSGWVWLIVLPDGTLKITSTPNQDNPLMDVVPENERGQPILALDVWEHAYYLKYNSRRADYIANWWQVVNWREVERLFEAAIVN